MRQPLRLVIFTCQMFALALPATLAAQIEFSPATHNFGKVIGHAVVNTRYWIRNASTSPVRIQEARPDCGCTDLHIPDSTIAPKDSVPMDVVFHSRQFVGLVEKRAHVILSSSPDKHTFRFYAEVLTKADTTTALRISPAKVDISQFGEKIRRKAAFTITNTSARDFQVTVVDSSFKKFDVSVPQLIKAGQTVQGQVILHENQVPASFEEGFTFELDDDIRSRYTVPVVRLYNPRKASGAIGSAPRSGS